MRRIGILLVAGLLAAAHGSGPAAGQAQRSGAETPAQSAAQGGWWRTFLPSKGKAQAQPRPTEQDQPVTQNITSENAKAEPAAASAKETTAKATTTKSRVARKQRRKQTVRRSKRKSQESRTASQSTTKRSSAEARWWEETGNPVVFAFSGCLADYAAASVRKGGADAPHAEYVTQAMAGPCKEPFDKMAGVILEKHGEKGFAKVSKELIETTFIPSVRNAIEKATAEIRAGEKRKVALGAEVQKAKDAMFACFVRETDRLAATSTAEARTVGEAVIASCAKEADLFFVKLDELYPDVSDGTQQSALSHSYLPAILIRVASVRAASRAASQ